MDNADPELQKVGRFTAPCPPVLSQAILESFRQASGPHTASGSSSSRVVHRRSSSEATFGRVDSLRRSGISPAASRCAHTPLPNIRLRRSRSLNKQSSKKSDKSDDYQTALEDPELRDIVEHQILLPSTTNRITFDAIAGLDSAKKTLTEAITLPLLMPDFFTGIREPWKGVLLFGPPGTGKTLLAKALASTDSIRFFNCPSSSLTSKYRGDSEKLVRTVFSMARKAAPSIVFFDEADALISKRGSADEHEASRRFKSEVLQQMDGVTSSAAHVMVLATSNCPWDIDEAILRRFEKRIYIPLPDASVRLAALRLYLQGIRCSDDVDVEAIAERLEGYSGADLRLICKDASMMFMRKWMEDKSPEEMMKFKESGILNAVATMEDFRKAIEKSSPSVRNVESYEKWAADYGSL